MSDVTHAQNHTRVVRYAKTRVQVSHGPDNGKSLDFAGSRVRLGTSADNDLVLTDRAVSRRHCALIATPAGIQVRDEGSTNGVFVGTTRVVDATFVGPFELRLGETILTITPLDDTIDREQSTATSFGDLVGQSTCMRELFAILERVAATDVSVLIEGETGTGKELVADSIHRASRRAHGPYVVFDCGAVAPSLAESELFGHERGAFTGAVATRPGVFEDANGGTLFLDELGELPKDLQPKLLRVLEKREVRRVGSNRTIPVDIRLLAATHKNLRAEVERGNFREDLYFRIATFHVQVPPLRDRLDDLPILVRHFLAREKRSEVLPTIPSHVWEMFSNHRWSGNVRELYNAVQRLLIVPEQPLAQRSTTTTAEPEAPDNGPIVPLRVARRVAAEAFEQQYVARLLQETHGNISQAANLAEVSRQALHKLLRKYGL